MTTPSEYLRRLVEQNPELLKRGGIFRRSSVHESGDWLRIVGLPRRDLDLSTVPDLTPLWATPNGTMKLWPVQSAALLEAETCNGTFIAMPVGTGKSLTAALMPDALQSRCIVILVPAQLKKRTLQAVYPELSKHFRLPLDRIHVVSYTEIERAPGDVLERLQPDLIVADEAHLLKNPQAARTARFLRYMKARSDTRLVVMSGTLTQRSILDYAHLIRLALKHRSPLPADYMTLTEWAEAVDVSDDPRPPGALLRLCEQKEHKHVDPSGRDHFRCRLVSSPGVLAISEGFKGTPLTIRRRAIEVPPKVAATIERLRKTWLLGNPEAPEDSTEEVVDDLTFARYCRQLSTGHYLRWDWHNGVRDEEWLSKRAEWNRAVRHVLRHCRKPGLDSPMLVARAGSREELGKEQQLAWEAWAAVKERKRPDTVVVWIDSFLVDNAVQWAQQPGIIWYEHIAVGEAIAKALGQRLSRSASDLVLDGRTQVLSWHIFGTGIDGLQRQYNRMLYTSVPNAKTFEQATGRLHREGQKAHVTVDILLPIPESVRILLSAFEQARYMHSTGFGEQKLLWATLEDIPSE